MAAGRLPAVVALLGGLLIVVASGVGAGSHSGRTGRASPTALRILLDAGLGIATVIGLVLMGLLMSAVWTHRKRQPPAEQRVYQAPRVPWALRLALVVLLLLLGGGVAVLLRGTPDERPSRPAPPATGELPLDQPPPPGKGPVGPDALAVVAVTVVGLTAVALVARRSRRRRVPILREARAEPRSTPVPTAGGIGTDDLLIEADPRRAVVAAYARMERVLGTAGVARHPSDAPFEFLARVRGALPPAGPPATRLTELFEWAKFSAAAVDRAMQSDAVDALRALIDHVAEAA